MDIKRYTPCNIGRTINRPIMLGKVGEINALRIEFDCEEWLTDYPDAAVELFVKRPDNDKYHPALGEDGYVRIWIIDERAVLATGSGVIELVLQDASSGTRIKSATGYTTVVSSPSAEGEASDLGFVAYSRAQNLTEAQKRQARNNIGAGTGTGAGTGSGTDGFSPTIKVEKIDGGNRLTITDIDGTKVVDVMDGKSGKNGDPGEDGRGIESVVRTSGDGSPGSTDIYTITYTDGYTSTLTVYNGKDGAAGEDGVSPTVAVETIDGGHRVTITSADSPKSFEVMDGKTGDPGAPGAPGEKGDAGRGISNIERTSGDGSAGTVDTYTIYYTDGTESTYQVRNGADGKDGSNAEGGGSSVELDNTLTQSGKAADAGAVGDALNSLKEAIDAKGDPTDEQVSTALSAYLETNPIEGGFTQKLRTALYNLLMDAVYQSGGHEDDKDALLELIGGTSGGGGEEEPEITYYTITKNLTNVSINNGAATVEAGASYNATLTADDGFTLSDVSVTMGGETVTVSDGVIAIASVTGNITITATATANETGGGDDPEQPSVGWENGQIITDLIIGESLTDSGDINSDSPDAARTDYIYIYGAECIRFIGHSAWARYWFFNEAKEKMDWQWQGNYAEVPEGAVYVIVSGGGPESLYPIKGIQILGAIEPTWTDGVPYELTIVKDEYYESGNITAYSGWDRTEMVNCYGAGKVVLSGGVQGKYCALYDTAGNYINKPTITDNAIVPIKYAGYVAFSAASGTIASLVVTPYVSAE